MFGGLGVVAVIAALAGIILGNKIGFTVLGGTILLMWVITTLRHLMAK